MTSLDTTAPAAAAARATAPASARTEDLHVAAFTELPTPAQVRAELPAEPTDVALVRRTRAEVRAVLRGEDDRLLVIVGPCSIHDPEAGLDYARHLLGSAIGHRDDLLVVMRAYFEKPRTTVGWKGLINDPHLDGSHDIATGLRRARAFLRDVVGLGLPCATEFLEPISPQYTADLVSWGAIGARTTESQIHRQLASGLSMPIGFKNGTDGGLQVAIDALGASAAPQSFLGIGADGRASLVTSTGNPDTSVILRGGADGPNYGPEHVRAASERLAAAGRSPRLIIDASHANSGKDHERQAVVAREIAAQVAEDGSAISGVMLESNLLAGAQRLDVAAGPAALVRGRSVTDACMGWDETARILEDLAAAVRRRRRGVAA